MVKYTKKNFKETKKSPMGQRLNGLKVKRIHVL